MQDAHHREPPWDPPPEAYRYSVERMNVGVAFIAPHTQRFLWVNTAFALLIGYVPRALIGQTWMSITDGDDIPDDLASVEEVLNGKRDHYAMSKRYLHKNGSSIPVHLEVFRYPADGDLVCLFAVVQEEALTAHKAEQFRIVVRAEMQSLLEDRLQVMRAQIATLEAPVRAIVEQNAALRAVVKWLPDNFARQLGTIAVTVAAAILGFLSHMLGTIGSWSTQ